MQSLWSEADAEAMVAHYGAAGITGDVALRVYTSRLLGGDPRLVLHGGGNTSVKTVLPDLLGEPAEVLCVKGSGWDMANIEPPGLPAVRLAPLRKLRNRARGLRADDRDRQPGRGAARTRPPECVCRRLIAGRDRRSGRNRADPARRLRAARFRHPRPLPAFRARFPRRTGGAQLRRR